MAKPKKSIITKLIFLYLCLYPFGQLLRFSVFTGSFLIVLNFIDLVALFAAVSYLAKTKSIPKTKISNAFFTFVLACLFSLILSFNYFEVSAIFFGALYFLRFVAYYIFFTAVSEEYKTSIKKKSILTSIFAVCLAMAIFGWIQYFFLPDLRALKYLGWDDHLYRLTGTLFDPGFSSLIFVFGSLLALYFYKVRKNLNYLILSGFMVLSVLFTYSRAGYTALAFGLIVFLVLEKKVKLIFTSLAVIGLAILFLPRPAGTGVKLERFYSITSRIENYKETIEVAKASPVFGVGYNNFCAAKQKYLKNVDAQSHSCSGSDSSLLLILATTGVVGFIAFVRLAKEIFVCFWKGNKKSLFASVFVALFVHSLFNNSLFFPWTLGFLALFGASIYKTSTNNEQ